MFLKGGIKSKIAGDKAGDKRSYGYCLVMDTAMSITRDTDIVNIIDAHSVTSQVVGDLNLCIIGGTK